MASTARQMSRDPSGFDLPGLARAFFNRVDLLAGDDVTSRAVASAGLAALVALPLLLLSSVLLAAPLAVPAAMCVCYLAVSHALSTQRPRRANIINSAILCGLVGWLLWFLLTGEGLLSHAGVIAALMAPGFAAAPAFARSLIARRLAPQQIAEPDLRDAALARVATLEGLTPTEQVLVLDREATVLAASSAARQGLGLLPDAFEQPIGSLLSAGDANRVFEAIANCKGEAEPIGIDLIFDTAKAKRPMTATLSPSGDGAVVMRLDERKAIDQFGHVAAEGAGLGEPPTCATKPAPQVCNIGEAVAFAFHRSSRRAEAGRVRLTSAVDPTVAATCDRQVGRRIVHLLIDGALDSCAAEGTVHIVTRRLKGVVLLRTTTTLPRKPAIEFGRSSEGKLDMTALQTLVDGPGGTLVADQSDGKIVVSVRLPLAPIDAASGEVAL